MGRLLPVRVRLVERGGFRDLERQIGERAQAAGISVVQTKLPRLDLGRTLRVPIRAEGESRCAFDGLIKLIKVPR